MNTQGKAISRGKTGKVADALTPFTAYDMTIQSSVPLQNKKYLKLSSPHRIQALVSIRWSY